MLLILESGTRIENPSAEEIARYLPSEGFAIITDGPRSYTYLQFAEDRGLPQGFVLEYQLDSPDKHFRAVNTPLTMEAIIGGFQKYTRGDGSWKSDFQWERMKVKNRLLFQPVPRCVWMGLAVLGVCILLLLIYWLTLRS